MGERFPFPKTAGDLQNLLDECPEEFKSPKNKWHVFACLFRQNRGADARGWLYFDDRWQENFRRVSVIKDVVCIQSPLSDVERDAIGGYLFSKILLDVPRYIPPQVLPEDREH